MTCVTFKLGKMHTLSTLIDFISDFNMEDLVCGKFQLTESQNFDEFMKVTMATVDILS